MKHPLQVYIGKIRQYLGSKPSAIEKCQTGGELKLTQLGLEGDEQAEKVAHGGPDRALCHYPREHTFTGRGSFRSSQSSSVRQRMVKTCPPKG